MTDDVIYLDYNATTPVDPRVVDVVTDHMRTVFGNASSVDHSYGDRAESTVVGAISDIRSLVDASSARVVLTSGATESINLALTGLANGIAASIKPLRIVVSPLEHKAVLDTCAFLVSAGIAIVRVIEVDQRGRVNLDDLETKCRDGVDLVCVMAANNEIGNCYAVRDIAAIAHTFGALFFCDATQAVGKFLISFDDFGIDLMAFSAHKMYGPKGAGVLVTRSDIPLMPIIHGGGHQRGLRSGTINVPGVAGLGMAARLRRAEMAVNEARIALLRDDLEAQLEASIPRLVVNGDRQNRLAGTSHVSIPGIPNGAIIARVRKRLALSTGSACTSGIEGPSHVLRALHLADDIIAGALRISIGKFTTTNDIRLTVEALATAATDVQSQIAIA